MKTTRTKTTTKKKRTVITKRWKRSAAACLALFALSTLAQPAAADKKEKPYALIFGTVYGPDDRPFYGAKITVHPVNKKHPSWDLISDHRGEFAQRIPPGPGDYLVHGEAEYASTSPDGKPQKTKAKRVKGDKKVHVDNVERVDISVHLTE